MASRARFSDVDNMQSLECDLLTVLAIVDKTKTSTRHADRLPVDLLGPLASSSGLDWLWAWLEFRKGLGICVPEFAIFPARQDMVWQKSSCSIGAANSILRDLLEVAGLETPQRFSSHSFKATTLTCACSFGIDLPTRKVLGYHSISADKSARSYSRDVLRGPVLKLGEMFASISEGTFDPDSRAFKGKVAVQAEMSESDSSDSGTESENEDVLETVANTTKFLMGKTVLVDHRWYHHDSSFLVHRGKPGALQSLACGKRITEAYSLLAAATGSDDLDDEVEYCDTCFAARKPEVAKTLKRLASQPIDIDACDSVPTAHELDWDQVSSGGKGSHRI